MPIPYPAGLHARQVINRHPTNPVLTPQQVPYPSTLVFNPGVMRYQGKYIMAFRNDCGTQAHPDEHTNIGLAESDDGIHWSVHPQPVFTLQDHDIRRAYDPRLIALEGRIYLCFAADTHHGVRAGIAVTDDFHNYEVLHLSTPDNRNVVLFPERIGGKFIRLERPFPVYSRGGERFDIWISASPDLRYWGDSALLIGVEDVPFSNRKIGPGAPPIKTSKGWLVVFHAVDYDENRGKNGWEASWKKRYTAGLALLDLENPYKVLSIYQEPLLAPEASYETRDGYRNDVIFPCAAVLDPGGEVKIYYGAADTVICLASASLDDLLSLVC
ncbi:MAG TPA: glycoside hydrolase family 130 protein [Anaerolineaceae bacterium]